MDYSYIKFAEYHSPFKIQCEFEDGLRGLLDLKIYIKHGGIFSKLCEEKYAMDFTIEGGVLTWNNGELDIAPETVYHLVTGKPLPSWIED